MIETDTGYKEFKNMIFKLTGIDLSCYKEDQMRRRTFALLTKQGFQNFKDYSLAIKKDKQFLDKFLDHMTINVTDFFRDKHQWEVLEKFILPDLLKDNKKPKVWSSASSTGEEPYSLVMLLSKFIPLQDINILATDIDLNIIEKAKVGLYSEKSIQNVPAEFVKKYFVKTGDFYRISDDIKKRVTFKQLNLLENKYPTNQDLVLCRNVMIYFTEQSKIDIYCRFSNSLRKNGVLFVGSSEQIMNAANFKFKSKRSFFYEKQE